MGGTRVYIGGLPYGVREKDLERFFKGYGRIRDILIKNGYGFVVSIDFSSCLLTKIDLLLVAIPKVLILNFLSSYVLCVNDDPYLSGLRF